VHRSLLGLSVAGATTAMALSLALVPQAAAISPSPSPAPTAIGSTTLANDGPTPTATPTGSPTATPPTLSPAAESIRKTQVALKALKFPIRNVDGIVTKNTRQVLCIWRELAGQPISRHRPTLAERTDIQNTPLTKVWTAPKSLSKVRFAVNMDCQSATWLSKGIVTRIMGVSTGKWRGSTRRGLFRTYWIYPHKWQSSSIYPEPDGRPSMYRPIYFDGNIAVHGSIHPINPIPESHGCIRTQRADQDSIFKYLKVGMKVWVYGDYWKPQLLRFGVKKKVNKSGVTVAPLPKLSSPRLRVGQRPIPIG